MGANKIGEGRTSYHQYKLLKPAFEPIPSDAIYIKDTPFVPVDSVESLKFKVSDGVSDLIAWTSIPPAAEGVIEIPGHINRVQGRKCRRVLTLFAVHDGGKHLPMEITYNLVNYSGINPDTPPTTQS